MCGICGSLNVDSGRPLDPEMLRTMVAIIGHRGPDEAGFYMDEHVGLGQARLSIIDLSGGKQPLSNEDRTVWVVFNGEIFNYIELRGELENAGHYFRTSSDTETIVHAYEQYGDECPKKFNGQFAFALWDSKEHRLFLARDRLGIRPLFYCFRGGQFIFGSEVKSLAVHPSVKLEIDPDGLDDIFTFWSTLFPRTAFKDIWEVPPGHYAVVENGTLRARRYWELSFPATRSEREEPQEYYIEGLRDRLVQATRLRLRADVPVGAYLSGGLDSSVITTIIKNYTDSPLITFSVRFDDALYDEGRYQADLIKHLGTTHAELTCSSNDIARAFSEVVWHTEKPILRTAPTPLFLLSSLVRNHGIKVVLTGEGADEFLGGYNIFKEAKIRRFWARSPDSQWRPLLLNKLYPYMAQSKERPSYYWQTFFRNGLTETELPYYSHVPRWRNTATLKGLFSKEIKGALQGRDAIAQMEWFLDGDLSDWDCLSRAQYVEVAIFLSGYLLSSQGDRVAMAHSVEGRFPFLDHNVVEFCSLIPPKYKLNGLNEKYILKKCWEKEIPASILKRPKQPYRAPDSACFLGARRPELVETLLSEKELARTGIFNARDVARLLKRIENSNGRPASARDDMAVAGILSTQLLHHHFIDELPSRISQAREAAGRLNVRVDERVSETAPIGGR